MQNRHSSLAAMAEYQIFHQRNMVSDLLPNPVHWTPQLPSISEFLSQAWESWDLPLELATGPIQSSRPLQGFASHSFDYVKCFCVCDLALFSNLLFLRYRFGRTWISTFVRLCTGRGNRDYRIWLFERLHFARFCLGSGKILQNWHISWAMYRKIKLKKVRT